MAEGNSRYDKLDTAVLQGILQADLEAPEAERLPVEEALYIAGLLAERRGGSNKTAAAAKAEFYEHYYPLVEQGEQLFYTADETEAEAGPAPGRRAESNILRFVKLGWRRAASMAAAVALLMFTGTITAYALTNNPPVEIHDLFSGEEQAAEAPVTAELISVMAQRGMDAAWAPKWLPEGYKPAENQLRVSAGYGYSVSSRYYREVGGQVEELFIIYGGGMINMACNQSLYEKGFGSIVRYSRGETVHYIMGSDYRRTVIWDYNGEHCVVVGKLTLDEAYRIIDSIYEE